MQKLSRFLILLAVGLSTLPVHGEEATSAPAPSVADVTSLQVHPTELVLTNGRDSRRLLVTGQLPSGKFVDVSDQVQLEVQGTAVQLGSDRFVNPMAVGSASVVVRAGSQSVTVPVTVQSIDVAVVSFVRDIEPIMTKVGCNQGTCHGAQQGKAGFKLSLRGYDPEYDYNALVDELAGRRFNRAQPEQSLMLLKPTQGVPHEGGFLFDEESREYALIRQWIAEGCQFDHLARVERIEVFPSSMLLELAGEKQSLTVIAHFADGTTRDVSREAVYDTSNFEVATVTKQGQVEAIRRGEASIIVRYEGALFTNVATVLGDRAGFAWNNSPEYNFIDKLVNEKLQRMKIVPADLCTDAEFLRRVQIDLTGVPPTGAEVRAFLSDTRESRVKREAKIEELLNSDGFVDYWTMKWSDLLLSNRKFLTEKGVWAYREWIREAIASNQPYDQFVREILTASGSTFENPATNYYRVARDPKLVMENLTQVFIGTRFMCAQCHDHPFEKWTQNQYYELSAFFSDVGRKPGSRTGEEVVYTQQNAQPVMHPKKGGQVAAVFPYEHAGIDPKVTNLREKLAQWLTAKENPYFAKSLANRYWSYFLGRGIIDPVDDIRSSNPPSNAELLDTLTQHFIDSGFDLKGLVRTIVQSHTYQRSVATNKWNRDDLVNYSHASPRRLGAEQLFDAIMIATQAPSHIPGVPADYRATQLPDGQIDLSFLDMFGRPPRESPCECERTSEVSLSQTLNLINGPTIGNAIADPVALPAQLTAANASPQKIVEDVYLSVVCRLPSEEELKRGEDYIASVGNPQEAAQDLMWALINSPAFLFNR